MALKASAFQVIGFLTIYIDASLSNRDSVAAVVFRVQGKNARRPDYNMIDVGPMLTNRHGMKQMPTLTQLS